MNFAHIGLTVLTTRSTLGQLQASPLLGWPNWPNCPNGSICPGAHMRARARAHARYRLGLLDQVNINNRNKGLMLAQPKNEVGTVRP